MRLRALGGLVAGLLLVAAPAGAEVRVAIAGGRVTVSAKDATLRQILTEWARVGQTTIVNSDRLAGPPLSLELVDVPEAQALDTLLRSVSGYLAAPRAVDLPNASAYDRIFLLPASTATPARPGSPSSAPPPAFATPVFAQPDDVDDDNVPRRVTPPNGAGPNGPRPPANAFPQPQFQFRQAPPAAEAPQSPAPQTAPAAGAPFGVARPGMPTPVPQQPGQQAPGQPAQPNQP